MLAAALVRRRRWIAAVLAGVIGLLTRTGTPDLAAFAGQAELMLRGHLGEVYAGAWNQAGPAQLLVSLLLSVGGSPEGTVAAVLVVALNAGFVLTAMMLCGRLTADTGGALAGREVFAGLLALLWLEAPLPWNGHPAEPAIPVLWAYAIVLRRRDRSLAAAAALALAVAIAPWAILGLPCLLAAAPLGRAVRTGLLAAVLGAGCYLPFVLAGHFAMFDLRWSTSGDTLAGLAGIPEVTWWLRLGQGVVVAGGVALIAWRCRGDRLAIGVVPLAATLLRILTDPVSHQYYWYPVAAASLVLFALVPADGPRWRLLAAGLLSYLALLTEAANLTVPGPLICLAVLLVVTRSRVPAFRVARRPA